MSFSFIVVAKTKQAAREAVGVKMAEVVAMQPSHKRDQSLVNAVTEAYLDLLDETPEGQAISVSVNGSVGWKSNPDSPYEPAEGQLLTSCGFGVQAYFITESKV